MLYKNIWRIHNLFNIIINKSIITKNIIRILYKNIWRIHSLFNIIILNRDSQFINII